MKPEVCPTSGLPFLGDARGVPHPLPCPGFRIHHTRAEASGSGTSRVCNCVSGYEIITPCAMASPHAGTRRAAVGRIMVLYPCPDSGLPYGYVKYKSIKDISVFTLSEPSARAGSCRSVRSDARLFRPLERRVIVRCAGQPQRCLTARLTASANRERGTAAALPLWTLDATPHAASTPLLRLSSSARHRGCAIYRRWRPARLSASRLWGVPAPLGRTSSLLRCRL